MKQFKVKAKNSVYSVFADSEVEAVNKVKEVELKLADSFSVNLPSISIRSIDDISISKIVKHIKDYLDRSDRTVKKITNGKFSSIRNNNSLEFQVYARDTWSDDKFIWGSVTLGVEVNSSVARKLYEQGGYALDKFISEMKSKLKTYENKTIYEDKTLIDSNISDALDNDIRVEWQKIGGRWMSRSFTTWDEAVAYAKNVKSNSENHSVGIQVNGYWFDLNGSPKSGKSLSQVLKKKVGDSKKLSDLAYELAQMANYFDRANSPYGRKWLAKDDEVMLSKFYNLGIQTLNQLKIDIDGMEKAGLEPNTDWWGDNKTYSLLKDVSSRMHFTEEPKLVALSKKFDPLIRVYSKLINGGNK